ncbi:MAG TPA: hypothetical protein VK158_03705 [Acidobacteriota bacterium]|nr:hypothetical protein [Acidobacteriota bacterium]
MKSIPLSNSFTLISMLALLVSGFLTYNGTFSPTWGFTFTLMFLIFVVASYVSIAPQSEKRR